MATMGSSTYLKRVNKATILTSIKEKGPLTRSDIAKLTKLGWGTITKFTKELVKEKIIIEEHQDSSRGRPSILLKMSPSAGFLIGVEIEPSGITALLIDLESNVLSKTLVDMGPGETKDSIIEKLFQGIEKVIQDSNIDEQSIKAIGIGVSAEVDDTNGVVEFSANLNGWRNLPIKAIIEARFERPCFVANSTTAVTLGERVFGARRGIENLVCVILGVGIGSGIVSHGQLLSTPPGKHVGDIGHIVVSTDGRRCGCGRSGCLEAFAGERALVDQAKESLRRGEKSLIGELAGDDLSKITAETLARAAQENDELAMRILGEAGKKISVGLISLIQLYQPDVIVLSGSLANTQGHLVDSIKDEIARTIPRGRFDLSNLVVTQLGDYVGALGATHLAWLALLDNLELFKKAKEKTNAAALGLRDRNN